MSAVKKTSRRRPFALRWQSHLDECITAIAANENWVAATSAAGEVALWSWQGSSGKCDVRSQVETNLSCLAFSAGGEFLAAGGQQSYLQVRSLGTPEEARRIDVPGNAWIDRLAWSPTAPLLAFDLNKTTCVWDAISQKIVAQLDFVDSSVLGLAWHPQGTHLAICGNRGTKVWDASNWQAEPYLLQVPGASLQAAWSPDGRFLAAGNFDRTLSILHWQSPPPWLMQGFPAKVRQVAWASDSQLVAAACAEGIATWQRSGEDWSACGVLQGHASTVRSIGFHPLTGQLASVGEDGRVCLWRDVKARSQTLEGPPGGCTGLAWHPTEPAIAVGGQQGELYVWAL